MKNKEIKIGIAGLGTVGAGVAKALLKNQKEIKKKTNNISTIITAVSASNKNKKRNVDLSNIAWYENAIDMSHDENIDIIVELIGGDSGIALELCEKALKNKKHLVTANKALIAKHGLYLSKLAEENNVRLMFEASVAAGIPIIKILKESLSANKILKISAILNGTCNYILDTMKEKKLDFKTVLKEAQDLGYAEADPKLDIEGIDSAHKLSIISSLAYGKQLDYNSVYVEGIKDITLEDIQYANELGYEIKLIASCLILSGKLQQTVYPTMLAKELPLSKVHGVNNAVLLTSDLLGNLLIEGPGAGEEATSSAVISDIIDIACDRGSKFSFIYPSTTLEKPQTLDISNFNNKFYINFSFIEGNNTKEDILCLLKENNISIKSILDKDKKNLVIITDENSENNISNTVNKAYKLQLTASKAKIIRIG